jgi:hypothetical protein
MSTTLPYNITQVIQNIIGHSCEELNAAVSDPNSQSTLNTKEIMNGFKDYLTKFEVGSFLKLCVYFC